MKNEAILNETSPGKILKEEKQLEYVCYPRLCYDLIQTECHGLLQK